MRMKKALAVLSAALMLGAMAEQLSLAGDYINRALSIVAEDAPTDAVYGDLFREDKRMINAAADAVRKGNWDALYQVKDSTFPRYSAVKKGIDADLRAQAKPYRDAAKDAFGNAYKYVIEDSESFLADNALIHPVAQELEHLFERYEELSRLISQYDDSADGTTALQGYVAERTRIFNEMKDLGLLSETIDAQGNTVYIPVSGLSVDTIILPDILASGGNITVQAGTLKGSGSLTAQGAPEVTIENHTNLYMKVGDVQAVNPGGEISYNSHSMKTGDTATIRDVNSDKAAAVSLSVTADADSSQGGVINITSDYGTAPLYAAIEGETASKSQKADIEINGSVKAENGVVNVTSNNYSILLQGTDSRTAEVSGKEIHLTAGKSISQGFTDGIVNIGGNPEMQYNGLYQQNKKDYNDAYGFVNTTPIHRQDTTNSEVKDGGGTRIAGDNIYINASDINVNGLIQSGYGSYGVTIEDSAVQSAVATLKKNWNASGQPELSDALVMTGSVYRVVKGGPVLQADGTYAYQPDVFYNPSTDKLVIPDIDAHGGQIYLSGRISSTGNGKIAALDGAYDITVNNNTDTDLQVGKLISNKAEGLISISDSAKNTVTEYRRNSTVVKDLTQWDKAAGDWKVISTGGAQSTYNPLENLRYNWTSGQKVSTTKEYTHTHKAGLWGAVTTLDKTALTKYEQEIKPVEKSKQTNYNDNGTYIGVENLGDSQYVFVYDNVVLNNTRSAVKTRTWRTGFLGWFKWEETKWTTSTGTAQQYVGSVKADHAVSIGFFGNADGNSAIQVASNAGVNLNGNIQSSQSGTGSTISIASKNGAITQDAGLVKGDNVTLQAAKGMENISIESLGDTVRLDALNTGSGDVSISVDGAYGKAGNVDLVQARNQNGDVSLTALGNLTQEGSGVTVEGNRITVQADAFAKGVCIESEDGNLMLSDNFFDMEKGSRTVEIIGAAPAGPYRVRSVFGKSGEKR